MPSSFENRLGEWVAKILDAYAEGCFSNEVPHKVMTSKVHKKYFQKKETLSYATLEKLRDGKACNPATILTFAYAWNLKAVDRSELLIRWGEAYINRYAYKVPDRPMDSFIRDWRALPDETLKDLNLDIIATLIAPRAIVANGVAVYLEECGVTLADLKSVKYSTVARFVAQGRLSLIRFNNLVNELKLLPQPPKEKPTPDEIKTFRQLERSLEKICASYIEASLDAHVLDLKMDDLKGSFDPRVHTRLAAWLVAVGRPAWEDSQLIETLFLP